MKFFKASHRGCSGITFYAVTDAVARPAMIVGRFENGIGYFSRENKPIDLVVMLAAPEHTRDQLEKTIICVKDILCDSDFMESVRNADNPKDIYKRFLQHCLEISLKQENIK